MTKKIEDVDLARILPCQVCGTPTRCMNVPIGGSGLDLVFADKTTCAKCLHEKCVKAADEVRARKARENG